MAVVKEEVKLATALRKSALLPEYIQGKTATDKASLQLDLTRSETGD